jgi:hypothetical protein
MVQNTIKNYNHTKNREIPILMGKGNPLTPTPPVSQTLEISDPDIF